MGILDHLTQHSTIGVLPSIGVRIGVHGDASLDEPGEVGHVAGPAHHATPAGQLWGTA